MIAEYPSDMIDVELGGAFPDFGGSMFPMGHIEWSTDQSLYDAAYVALHPEAENGKEVIPGYILEEDMRHGIIHSKCPTFQAGSTWWQATPGRAATRPGTHPW